MVDMEAAEKQYAALEAERDALRARMEQVYDDALIMTQENLRLRTHIKAMQETQGGEETRLRARVEELEREAERLRGVEDQIIRTQFMDERPTHKMVVVTVAQLERWANREHERDLAVAEAVREACDAKVCGETLDLAEIVKGVKT